MEELKIIKNLLNMGEVGTIKEMLSFTDNAEELKNYIKTKKLNVFDEIIEKINELKALDENFEDVKLSRNERTNEMIITDIIFEEETEFLTKKGLTTYGLNVNQCNIEVLKKICELIELLNKLDIL